MLAVVKGPRTKWKVFEVVGEIPDSLVGFLREKFGKNLMIIDDDEGYVDIKTTSWYKKQKKQSSPGKIIRVCRDRDNMTQAELGERLGVSDKRISDYEHNRRDVSKDIAKKLASIFGTSLEKFIE